MTSIAPLASIFLTLGQLFILVVLSACATVIWIAYATNQRCKREEAEEAELIRWCQDGERMRQVRERRRCLGGRRAA